ncbi:Hypothetical predicted protein, partial [Paramuricea clavata]
MHERDIDKLNAEIANLKKKAGKKIKQMYLMPPLLKCVKREEKETEEKQRERNKLLQRNPSASDALSPRSASPLHRLATPHCLMMPYHPAVSHRLVILCLVTRKQLVLTQHKRSMSP